MNILTKFKSFIEEMKQPVRRSIPLTAIEAGMTVEFQDRRDNAFYRGEVEAGGIYFDDNDCPHLICKLDDGSYTAVYQSELTDILEYPELLEDAA